jgi:hypothetical protein
MPTPKTGRLITHAMTGEELVLGRAQSSVVATRVRKVDAARFVALARGNGTTPGQLLRTLVLASSAADPSAATIAAIAKLVGLPEDALPAEVVQAVQDLAAEIPMADAASADPLDGGGAAADPVPTHLSKGITQRAEMRAARSASDPLRAVQAARREQARRR